jgi:hypothetical protein
LRKSSWYLLNMRLSGPPNRCECHREQKEYAFAENRTLALQLVARRYTD